MNFRVSKPVGYKDGLDMMSFAKMVTSDIMDINHKLCYDELKLAHSKKNQRSLNDFIKLHREFDCLVWTLMVMMGLMKFIFGADSREFWVVHKVYHGAKGQRNMISSVKQVLKYIELPDHYLLALSIESKTFWKRIDSLHKWMQEYLKITPLWEYQNSLPEGVLLDDDIYEFFGFGDGNRWSLDREEAYIHHISSCINFDSPNQMREKYLEIHEAKRQEEKRQEELRKQQKLLQNRDIANDVASRIAKEVYRQSQDVDEPLHSIAYNQVLRLGYKKPKIFVLVNAWNASSKKNFPPRYFTTGMKFTSVPTRSMVFDDDAPLPKELQELYDSCKYGYAEIRL